MSGTALAALGFAQSVANGRLSLFPVTDNTGRQVLTQDGGAIYRGVDAYVALVEEHHDEMHITEHPVAQGTTIADHAYRTPSRLTMQMGWSPADRALSGNINVFGVTLPTFTGFYGSLLGGGNQFAGLQGGSKLRDIYQAMLDTMAARRFMTISTGKRLYSNMLIRSVQETTNSETENVLVLTVQFQEILLATVKVTNAPINTNPGGQFDPQGTMPPANIGPQQPKAAPATSYDPRLS